MALTPEQFNKLATKDDLKELKEEMVSTMVSKEEFHSVMDVVIKKLDNIEHSYASNIVAHDRFETNINTLNKRMTVVEEK